MKLVFVSLIAALFATTLRADPLATSTPTELNFTSSTGIRWTITADGINAIHIGQRRVASGGWYLESAQKWYPVAGEDLAAAPIEQKQIELVSDRVVRVRHVQGPLTIAYTYTFDGEDLQIKAWVENHHASAPLQILQFSGLTIDFGQPPTGFMPLWHFSYTHANPDGAWHPMNVRIGASWGIGKDFGVGFSPADAFSTPTLAMWDWRWEGGFQEKDPQRLLRYFVKAAIPPETARTFTTSLRCSANSDWKNLVAPYKAYFAQRFGDAIDYTKVDHRPLMQSVLNRDAYTQTNPYGIHDGRRIDSADGVAAYGEKVVKALTIAHGQGVILWAQGGSEKRGGMYRPDFDILPPEITENLPKLADRLKSHGFKLGVTARPNGIAQRATWTTDWVTPMSPAPFDIGMLSLRFRHMIDLGSSLFYLDSFGNSPDDPTIMRGVRATIGASVQTYAEQGSDVIIGYSGLYTELGWSPSQSQYVFAWLRPEDIEFFRWLAPGLPISAKVRPFKRIVLPTTKDTEIGLSADQDGRAKKVSAANLDDSDLLDERRPQIEPQYPPPVKGVDEPILFLLKHHITPMFEDGMFWNYPDEFKHIGELSRRFLDDAGRSKDEPE